MAAAEYCCAWRDVHVYAIPARNEFDTETNRLRELRGMNLENRAATRPLEGP